MEENIENIKLYNGRTKCEVFSRVVGFVRRVDAWNYGKQAEFKDRKLFKVEENENK